MRIARGRSQPVVTEFPNSSTIVRVCTLTLGAVLVFGIPACSPSVPLSGSSPTATTAATTITRSPASTSTAPPVPKRVKLEKEWKTYGGTAYYGCGEGWRRASSEVYDVKPKVFRPSSGTFVAAATPDSTALQDATDVACSLSGSGDQIRVVYLINSTTPARGLEPTSSKTTAYLFEVGGDKPLAKRDLPLVGTDVTVSPTATGVALARYEDTSVLSNDDLATLWTAPGEAAVWKDVLVFKRYLADPEKETAYGIELRIPNGEVIYQNDDMWYVDAVLSDGDDTLVDMVFWNSYSPARLSTMFFDLKSRAMLNIPSQDQLPDRGYKVTLSDGKLFIRGTSSETDVGLMLWNLRTQQIDFQRTPQEVSGLTLRDVYYFQNHLYLVSGEDNFSVIDLPDTQPIAASWSNRPFGRISGWTLICRGTAADAENCSDGIELVADQNGGFPGPWT